MRRAIAATVGTIAGIAGVLHFKTTPLPHAGAAIANGTTGMTAPTSAPAPGGGDEGAGAPVTTTAPATTAPVSAKGTRVVKGAPVDNRFGTVQVQVTLQGNRILDVQPLQMPFDHQRSQFISEQVAPMLRQEVIDAQTAQIDAIGGATYTSESYAESLQSALDTAKK